MNTNIEQLEKQKHDIEIQIKITSLIDELYDDNPIYMLANVLHKMHCRHNHTDGCGWFYFDWDKTLPNGKMEYSRAEYLKKAEAYVACNIGLTVQEIINNTIKLYVILRGY